MPPAYVCAIPLGTVRQRPGKEHVPWVVLPAVGVLPGQEIGSLGIGQGKGRDATLSAVLGEDQGATLVVELLDAEVILAAALDRRGDRVGAVAKRGTATCEAWP
jgi:hypothetical protein